MKRRPLCLMALAFVCWIAGMKMAGGYQLSPLPEFLENQTIRVRGQIYRQETKKNHLIYLRNNSILSNNQTVSYTSNIIVFTTEKKNYEIGNILEVTGVCKQPEKATNPGQFDMEKWYQVQGIGMMIMKGQPRILSNHRQILSQGLYLLKEKLKESFYTVGGEKDAPLLCAMVLGEKNDIENDTRELYQLSGISHILAISGVHVSLIGMSLFWLFRKSSLPLWMAAMGSGGLLGMYCLMTGMGISTLRAFLMFLIYLGAQVLGRTYDLKSALSFAVILILMQNPLWLFQGGFQLSALAVGGLAFLQPVLIKRFGREQKWKETLMVSFSVQLAIFPCMLYHYFEFSWTGIFLNLLVLPCMSVLLMFGVFSCLLGVFLPVAGIICFAPCHYILRFYEEICKMSLRVPGGHQVWGKPEMVFILLYYGILVAMFFILHRWEKNKWCFPLCLVCIMAGIWGLKFHGIKGLEMVFLDVGQGDSIYWKTKNGVTFLCDGGSSSVAEVGKYRIEPFLKSQGAGAVDYVFLTHMDEDHVNGVEELLEKEQGGILIRNLVLPHLSEKNLRYQNIEEVADRRGISVVYLHSGMEFISGKLKVECLSPEAGEEGEEKNAASIVLELEYGEFRALLTGDVEGEGEEKLVKEKKLKRLSVLKVAHHGSRYSTSDEFLKASMPEVSVISSSSRNLYGHPHEDTLARLENVHCSIWCTKDQGAITIRTDGKEISVRSEKYSFD